MNVALRPSRREFLKVSAAATVAAPNLATMLRAGAAPAVVSGPNLNSRIGVGFIGAGSRAGAHMRMLEQLRASARGQDETCNRRGDCLAPSSATGGRFVASFALTSFRLRTSRSSGPHKLGSPLHPRVGVAFPS